MTVPKDAIIGHCWGIDIESEYAEGISVAIYIATVERGSESAGLGKPIDGNANRSTIALIDDQEDL